MVVWPPPPFRAAVNRHELAEDVALPDFEIGLFAPELEILRDEADRREREDLGLGANLGKPIDHSRCADAATLAETDMLADHRVRSDDRAGTNPGAFHHDRSRMDADAVRDDGEQQIHFGNDLLADIGDAARLRHRRPRLHQRHFEPQLIAGNDLPAELRAIDAVQIDARHRHRPFAIEHQGGGHLCQRLQHEDAGHERRCRENAPGRSLR